MARILLTDPLDAEGVHVLRAAGHDVVDGSALSGAARDAEIAKAEGWVIRSGTRITAEDIAKAKRLRAIGRAGVGVDNVDLAAATARGVAVFHAPTGNITSAAEQAWALMLACARRVNEADAGMKQGTWDRKLEGVELAGKTLFLVGLGRIGRMMAQRAQAFEMDVIGYDPFVTPDAAKAMGVTWVALDDGLARADVVSLHTPLTAQTRHVIDAGRLACMKSSAILVNAARGPLIDPASLLVALEAGRLRAAGLDVWEDEPPKDWALAKHKRVVAAPHLGASTREAQAKAAIQACERLVAFLATGDSGLAVNAQAAVDNQTRPWVALAESLAGFGVHLLREPLTDVMVAASAGLEAKALQVHALVGALRASADGEGDINAINAPGQASERGWSVAGRVLPGKDDPKRIAITLQAGKQTLTVEGTHTPHYGSRVTRLDGFDVDFRPEGRFLVTRHRDVPGVLARITAALATHKVNVANVSLARDHANGTAMAVIQVDGAVPVAVRDELRAVDAILEAHRVRVLT
ncbi:MAG: phosphoglycerate dehydrogenase [Candidatus Thermoplasmatota archaeon]